MELQCHLFSFHCISGISHNIKDDTHLDKHSVEYQLKFIHAQKTLPCRDFLYLKNVFQALQANSRNCGFAFTVNCEECFMFWLIMNWLKRLADVILCLCEREETSEERDSSVPSQFHSLIQHQLTNTTFSYNNTHN